jgi:3-oxoacyl-[acyl-carrier-protein] synthase-3
MKAFIRAISTFFPEKVLTNAELIKDFPEWSDKKIRSKIGISQRHIASENECASDLAVGAAENLFTEHRIDRQEIDFLLFCTQTPDYLLPSTACIIQDRLHLPQICGALDFCLGCSGYIYGLALAKGLIESGTAKNVLLLTADTYTKYLHPRDRGNRTIFGDAATATLISNAGFAEIGNFSLGTDGKGAENLILRTGCSRYPNPANDLKFDEDGCPISSDHIFMDGPEIFNFTIERIPELVAATLSANNTTMPNIDRFVFHQANKYILNYLQNRLEIDDSRFCYCLDDVGNTVSSTIPIALYREWKENSLKGNILLAGFGVGYSWGGCVLKINPSETLSIHTDKKDAYIKALSVYLPEKVLTNDELTARFPEWKTLKKNARITGVYQRHLSDDDQFASDLAIAAAENLFNEHSIDRSTVDFLIFCTQSPDYLLPTSACIIQERLGLSTSIGAIDVKLGCSGYVYCLALAKGLIASGIAKNVLLLTGDAVTKFFHPDDKGNIALFGDAATATLVSTDGFGRIGNFSVGTDGSGYEDLIIKGHSCRFPKPFNDLHYDESGNPLSSDHFYMNGPEVFNFTVERVPGLVDDTLAVNELKKDDINLFVFHQANKYMLDFLRDMLGVEEERFYIYLSEVGNISSSTVPMAMYYAGKDNLLKGNVLLAGFGVGYSWAGNVVQFTINN